MNELAKVRALLPHWIEHNSEHAAEFLRWADKVGAASHKEVAEDIALAAKQLDQVNETLAAALEALGGQSEGVFHHEH